MTGLEVFAVAAAALMIVALAGLIVDGPRAAVYPAVTAICCGLLIYLDSRYPKTLRQWTSRRVIDTAVVIVLAAAFLVAGLLLTVSEHLSSWTTPVAILTLLVAYGIAHVVAAAPAPNERHGLHGMS